MPHRLIASPFLDGHLLLRPGARSGTRIPADHYEQLRAASAAGQTIPRWVADTAADTWGLDVAGLPVQGTVLVREPSMYGYCRASWEINLGCNYGCPHCYLGERPIAGLGWEDKVRLLDIMREAGVLWLQITGGEPTMDRDFERAYRYAWLAGMMLTISTNGSRPWHPDLLRLFRDCPPYRLVISLYGASEASYETVTQRRGSWKAFRRGMGAAREACLPLRLNLVVHRPDRTLIPTLSIRGRGAVKVFAYGHHAGILSQAAELAAKLAAEHGVPGARVVRPLGPEAVPADGVRIQLQDFTARPCGDPAGPVRPFTTWPAAVRDTFAPYAKAMTADGLSFLYTQMQAERCGPVLTAALEGRVVGAIGPMEICPDALGHRQLMPQYFAVLPEARGKGLGRLLWRTAMHWGQSHGADYQLLQTETGGASDRLCRAEGLTSLGFVRAQKV